MPLCPSQQSTADESNWSSKGRPAIWRGGGVPMRSTKRQPMVDNFLKKINFFKIFIIIIIIIIINII